MDYCRNLHQAVLRQHHHMEFHLYPKLLYTQPIQPTQPHLPTQTIQPTLPHLPTQPIQPIQPHLPTQAIRLTQPHLPILHTPLIQQVIHHPYTQHHRHLPILPHHIHQHQLILHLHIHHLHKLHRIILQVNLFFRCMLPALLLFNSSLVLNFPLFFNQVLILEHILHHDTKNGLTACVWNWKEWRLNIVSLCWLWVVVYFRSFFVVNKNFKCFIRF